MCKKRIFLTGATGVMGSKGLEELLKYPEEYDVTILVRDNAHTRKALKPLAQEIANGRIHVITGDLCDKDSVAKGVAHADIILHVGGMVSPYADWYPEETIQTNIGAMRNIIEAAKNRPDPPAVVYIGSVAQYGHRDVPNHWGGAGDPLSPAYYDAYAYSKTEAERLLADSDLPKWVSLRQTGILHSGLLKKANDPIAFHVPIEGVLEWVTAEDSGRLLERVCRDTVPESFWRKFYNIGGGAPYRMTNYEFESRLLKAMRCPAPEKIFDAKWFALRNFHGFWFSDSDKLESILHFRSGTSPDAYFKQMKSEMPWYYGLAPLAPAWALKMGMKRVANTPGLGPMWGIKNWKEGRITAYFGSLDRWKKLKGWESFNLKRPADTPPQKSSTPQYTAGSIAAICSRRGMQGIPQEFLEGETKMGMEGEIAPDQMLTLICRHGHSFRMKARTLIEGGHWCPECMKERVRLGEE